MENNSEDEEERREERQMDGGRRQKVRRFVIIIINHRFCVRFCCRRRRREVVGFVKACLFALCFLFFSLTLRIRARFLMSLVFHTGPRLWERGHYRRRGQTLSKRPVRNFARERRRKRPTSKIHRRLGRPRHRRPRRSARGRRARKLWRFRGDFKLALKFRPENWVCEGILFDWV